MAQKLYWAVLIPAVKKRRNSLLTRTGYRAHRASPTLNADMAVLYPHPSSLRMSFQRTPRSRSWRTWSASCSALDGDLTSMTTAVSREVRFRHAR